VIVMDHGVPVLEIKPCRSAGRRPLDALRQSLVSYLDPTCAVAEVDWTDGG
jgi:hypothetical protein